MKFLIIGLGSMGKRRIRCLLALGYAPSDMAGVDLREDRRIEASKKYGVMTYAQWDNALNSHVPDALIISVPPDRHHLYMKKAVKNRLPFFVEASVLDSGMRDIISKTNQASLKGIPSATMMFHPAIKLIRQYIEEGHLGKISNITFHSGQYLPDWHTYESVNDFYVSNKETGGAREITPFELTWITQLFGFPRRVSGIYKKTIDISGAETIDDTYSFLLDYESYVINGLVDVVSRAATRKLLINGDQKQLAWDWNKEAIEIYDPQEKRWKTHSFAMQEAEGGYDHRIGENMYIDEMSSFIKAIEGDSQFPNTLERDLKVLHLLYAIEQASDQNTLIKIDR